MILNCRIVIADDHPIFRAGLKDILRTQPGIEIVGEAADGMEAYQLVLEKKPDIVLLDLEMPLLSGIDICEKLTHEKSPPRVIILTMHKERHFFAKAMKAGVSGYMLKDNAINEVFDCMRAISEGKNYVSKEIDRFLTEHNEQRSVPEHVLSLVEKLSPTEKIIIKLISESKTTAEIAGMLFISPSTVENHRTNISRKLSLEGKNSLMKFALQYKAAF